MSNQSTKSLKQQQKFKPIRICNCPCVLQIQQNEKIIQLQNQYTKTIQIENLRRNQQRISLQAEIKSLKLQLEQPDKEKQEIVNELNYYKKLFNEINQKLRLSEEQLTRSKKEIKKLDYELMLIKNQREKFELKSNLNADHVQELKSKMNSMYMKVNQIQENKRVSSIAGMMGNANKKQQNLVNMIDVINRKWQQYDQEMKNKYQNDIVKIQLKYSNEINVLKEQCKQYEGKYIDKLRECENLFKIRTELEGTLDSQVKQRDLIENMKNRQIQNLKRKYQEQISKLNYKIIVLDEDILLERQNMRRERQISKDLLGKLKQLQMKYERQVEKVMMKIRQNKQVQTCDDYQEVLDKKQELQKVKCQLVRVKDELREKMGQISKLNRKIEVQEKTIIMLKEKSQQFTQQRQEVMKCLNNGANSSLLRRQRHSLILPQQINSNVTSFEFIREALVGNLNQHQQTDSSAAVQELKTKIEELNQEIKMKDNQIFCLQEVNSSLKKLKIQSLEDQSKISALQRENIQLRKILSAPSYNNNNNQILANNNLPKSRNSRVSSRISTLNRSSVIRPDINNNSSCYGHRQSTMMPSNLGYLAPPQQPKFDQSYIKPRNKYSDSMKTNKSMMSSDSQNPDLSIIEMLKQKNSIKISVVEPSNSNKIQTLKRHGSEQKFTNQRGQIQFQKTRILHNIMQAEEKSYQ